MKKVLLTVIVVLGLGVTSAHAFDWFDGRLSLGGGFGRVKPKLPYDYQDQYQDGDMWTANMKYFLNNDFSLVLSYADLEPYLRGNNQDFDRYRPTVLSVRYNLFHHLPVTPYLTAGAGWSYNDHQAPGIVQSNWSSAEMQGGVGMEFFITEGFSLGAEALYQEFSGKSGIAPTGLASLVGMANVYFGPGPSQKRTEAALQQEKADAEKARADALAAQQQAQLAQQQAATAQQGKTAAEVAAASATAAAQQDAANAKADAQQKVAQAMAEVASLKQMMASKQTNPISFKTGSSELLISSNETLDKVVAIAKKYPSLKLRVEGYTDNVGGDELNQTLSEKRANAVRDYIVNKGGIPGDQVTAVGYGKGNPIASNDTAAGRAQNRRVEFTFYVS